MPSLVHEGDVYVLTKFQYECLLCDDVVESKHERDFVSCKCGALSLDGGLKSGRILGNAKEMRDVSIWTTQATPSKTLPQSVLDNRQRRVKAKSE